MALSCRKYLTAIMKIAEDNKRVGIEDNSKSSATTGVEDILTIKTVGIKFKIASK